MSDKQTDCPNCAAMREALEAVSCYIPGGFMIANIGRCKNCDALTSSGAIHYCEKCTGKMVEQALTSTAGADLLERVGRYEAALREIVIECESDNSAAESVGWIVEMAHDALRKEAGPE